MIKAIIFDCFGVLTTDRWKEFSGNLPSEVREQARQLNHAYGGGFITRQEFIEQVAEVTARPMQTVLASITGDSTKNQTLLDYIKQLKQDYKIGLISNIGNNWICDSFLNTEEQALFDEMILSYQVGTTKPDPRIYQIACEKLGVEPAEVIFIDDIETYCQAAEAQGMKAVVYHDFNQTKQAIDRFVSPSAA